MKKYLKVYLWMAVLALMCWSCGPAHVAQWTAQWRAAHAGGVAEPAPAQVPAGAEAVTWTNITNCTLIGRTLRKNRGSSELTDAGANSTQTIGGKGVAKANGYVEFRALENNKNRYLGLTNDFAGTSHATIDFALHLTNLPYRGATVAEVRENDKYKTEVGYQPNDVFRIAVENSVIKYYRNGAHFYTSENKPTFPLVADCSMLQIGATLAEVFIATKAGVTNPVMPDKTPPVLSDFNVMPLGGTTAITFTTDEPATTQLEYGLTLTYGNTMAVNVANTEHRYSLIGLTQNTAYHYRVKARDAAGNIITSKDMVLTSTPSVSSGVLGVLDKNQILVPANYTSFTPPAVGGQYVDSSFGTTVTRLSDGWKTFKDGVHHEYATMSPFNLDNTMIFLQGDNTGYFIVDRSGKLIARMEFSNSAEPRWSHTESDVFYYHEENRLMKYSVTARRATTVATFNQYQRITFGGGESDISEDGDHLLIVGDMRHVGLFQLSAGKMKRSIDLTALSEWAEAIITANNNISVRWEAEGEGKYQGLGLFDSNMNFVRKVLNFGAHSDQTRDGNGDEIIVMGAYRDVNPPAGCENNGVMKVRLSDSKKTCLVPLDWDQEIHVSANTNGKHRWVLVSGTDVKGTADLPNKLQPDWQKKWRPRVNELILVKTDGSERRRIVHHRGRVAEFYWWQPRATLSKDGKFAIFDSNFGFNPTKDYTDSFLVNLTSQK
ncbi:MAG: hypothetical protein HOP19_12145 [Acidobacteria bacterium]|nr:hypothetical protein [Acidobacteriota bacterium]